MTAPKAHDANAARHRDAARALHARGGRLSLVLLALIVMAIVCLGAGIAEDSGAFIAAFGGVVIAFLTLRAHQARVDRDRDVAQRRAEAHERHLARASAEWLHLDVREGGIDAPYAHDLDLGGEGSWLHRYDVTQSVRGARTLREWLSEPATTETLALRQRAAQELAAKPDFRVAFEVALHRARLDTRERALLDDRSLVEFLRTPSAAARAPWMRHARWVGAANALVLAAYIANMIPKALVLASLVLTATLAWWRAGEVARSLGLVAARRGLVGAYRAALEAVRGESFEAPHLKHLHARLAGGQTSAFEAFARFELWAGLAELRTQGPLYVLVNTLLCWDWVCLVALEDWRQVHTRHGEEWFGALAELEALASFAAMAELDPAATFPEVHDGGPFAAEGLVHPLLPYDARVANDLTLAGPGAAGLITGSNMAGKSTLLRAAGLAVAVGLAGGPVTARRLRLPRVRLGAAMRVEDSLQAGASYFRAELDRLRTLLELTAGDLPVLFLLDELLRGTNEQARHRGARAVVEHLLAKGAMGLVATHDVALASLETDHPGKVWNAHFTDLMSEGEMQFDYILREGVVKSSNALALLRSIGIDVPDSGT